MDTYIQGEIERLTEYGKLLANHDIKEHKALLSRIGDYFVLTYPNDINNTYILQVSVLLHQLYVQALRSGWDSKKRINQAKAMAAELVEIIRSLDGTPRPARFFELATELGEALMLLGEIDWYSNPK